MQFKLGELFCGPGGLALGAALCGSVFSESGKEYSISHVWGVDQDKAAIASYSLNIAKKYGGRGLHCDAMKFCQSEIYAPKNKITALAFGFPCNDFSLVGKQQGVNGQYGRLYKAGIMAINQWNPRWFIAENVSGIHSANEGKAFKKILAELKTAGDYGGYKLTAHLYKFEDYGVPQMRHRFIIVGIRKGYNKCQEFRVPAPTHGPDSPEGCPKDYVSAKEEIDKIKAGSPNIISTKQHPRIVRRLQFTPPWENAWYLEDLLKLSQQQRRSVLSERLPWFDNELSHLSDTDIVQEIEDCRLHCTKAKMSHIYRRLHPEKPSYTITGSGGGGTHVYHWAEHRALTNRERARLQGFPDDFDFQGTKEEKRKQIGMAVPPSGAKIIFKAILETYAGVQYKSVDANYAI